MNALNLKSYLNKHPAGTTHVWLDALKTPTIHGSFVTGHRLAYYKQVDGEWWVFSEITGWRKSMNTAEWFETEIKEELFVPIPLEDTK